MTTLLSPRDDATAKPRGGFAQVEHDVMSRMDISNGAKVLWVVMQRYWRDQTVCWASQETLAADIGASVSTVQRLTRELKQARFMRVSGKRHVGAMKWVNEYERLDRVSGRHLRSVLDPDAPTEIEGSEKEPPAPLPTRPSALVAARPSEMTPPRSKKKKQVKRTTTTTEPSAIFPPVSPVVEGSYQYPVEEGNWFIAWRQWTAGADDEAKARWVWERFNAAQASRFEFDRRLMLSLLRTYPELGPDEWERHVLVALSQDWITTETAMPRAVFSKGQFAAAMHAKKGGREGWWWDDTPSSEALGEGLQRIDDLERATVHLQTVAARGSSGQ